MHINQVAIMEYVFNSEGRPRFTVLDPFVKIHPDVEEAAVVKIRPDVAEAAAVKIRPDVAEAAVVYVQM
jgi:hypothetical protein